LVDKLDTTVNQSNTTNQSLVNETSKLPFVHKSWILKIMCIHFIFIDINGSVNINSNLIENLPLYSMSLYGQDGSIYDSQQLEKVFYKTFLFVICTSIYLILCMITI